MKLSLFYYLVSTEPKEPNEPNPFEPMAHYTLWQRVCRKVYMTLYRQRYIDHVQLKAYRAGPKPLTWEDKRKVFKELEHSELRKDRDAWQEKFLTMLDRFEYTEYLATLPPGSLISARKWRTGRITIDVPDGDV